MTNVVEGKLVTPPKSWTTPDRHYHEVLSHPWYSALVRLQNSVSVLTTKFWDDRDVLNMHLPITTGSISSPMGLGSDSTPVKVNLLGVETFLADSMQFMLELGSRLSPEGAYYLMPSFRGEDADSSHLSQFFHSEAEVRGGLDDVMALVENYLRYLVAELLQRHRELIADLAGTTEHLEAMLLDERPFTRLTFQDAVDFLGATSTHIAEVAVDGRVCRSLKRSGERKIMDRFGDFTWVTHMDHMSVPFYQATVNGEFETSLTADLLFGVGETVGAGERHETAEQVLAALDLHGVDSSTYEWYVEMRRAQPMKTSGFGMGVERFLMWLLKHDDIRDMSLLIRFNGMDVLP